ncbi:MAG: lipoate--protein ligase family protein, partial [Bacteroidia bacterium]|nr:lipoate--protein ligase family protein [Bacteroidia bacterium]
ALKVNPLKFQDKAVKSVRSRVTNISAHLTEPLSVSQFYDLIIRHIAQKYDEVSFYEYTSDDIAAIEKLADEKYRTWDWNFGYSPKYTYRKLIKSEGGNIEIYIFVEKGVITEFKFFGDFFNVKDKEEIETALIGKRHEYDAINACLSQFKIPDYFNNTSQEDIMTGMF